MSGPPRLPRVPPGSPIPTTEGPLPSAEAFRGWWSKTRAVRVYPGGLGEHGPLARDPAFEASGAALDDLLPLLAFEVNAERFRFMSLGGCAFELRGRLLRVGLLAVEAGGAMRLSGFGSDVRLKDPEALFAWLRKNGGPTLAQRDNTSGPASSEGESGRSATQPEGASAIEGGAAWGVSEAQGDLRDLHTLGDTLVAVDGRRLVRFDGPGEKAQVSELDRLIGAAGSALYGLRGRDLIGFTPEASPHFGAPDSTRRPPRLPPGFAVRAWGPGGGGGSTEILLEFSALAQGHQPRTFTERVIRDVSAPWGSSLVVAADALYVATNERRAESDETGCVIVRLPLSDAPSARVFEAPGLITSLAGAGDDVALVVRRMTRPFFGAARARHELWLLSHGAKGKGASHVTETEPSVSLSVALGKREQGPLAWLWSPSRNAITWRFLSDDTSGEIDAGGSVWGLAAEGDRAFAVAERGEGRLAVVTLKAGAPAEPIGSFRARPRRFECALRGGAAGVVVGSELWVFGEP